ncbi:amino acid-binding protein [Tomitella fengzijianii]|uniref:Amino acid-binding protein n=1 Tax=Tomitella fengzijianii TaxID=2597660 RepID=A0A516X3U4_9ACTN|nr:amino acid-binding protein [Tomitella fengzijianii]QDQ97752.1 amino acid-binding protein [Tomitella fengzijianii]
MSYLLRVVLPDRPGTLGLLALALGEAGADIQSLDVIERSGGYAVDDIVVNLPTGALPDVLITAAEAMDDTVVDAIRPFVGNLDTHRELELIELVAGAPRRGLQRLVDAAPRALQVHWAAVLDNADGRPGTAPLHASAGTPETWPDRPAQETVRSAQVVRTDADWVPEAWRVGGMALAAAPIGDGGPVLLLGRNGGPQFRPAEVARLGYITGIIGTVVR